MSKKIIGCFFSIILLVASFSTIGIGEKIQEDNASFSDQSNTAPSADAGGPYVGKTNIAVQFDGSNTEDSDGNIVSYTWYCGDGRMETGEITSHVYKHPGTYTLLLKVIDADDQCSTDETTVSISPDDVPTLSFINPFEQAIFYKDTYLLPINGTTILIGPNTITINAEDDVAIHKVEIFIDDQLKHADATQPYSYTWKNGILKHTITATAIDTSDQSNSISLPVFKWNIHPIFLLFLLYKLKNKDQNYFDWIENDHIFFDILKNIFLKQNTDISDNSILEFIKNLKESNDINTFDTILQFLNNRPLLKQTFTENYPLLYIYIHLRSSHRDSSQNNVDFSRSIIKIISSYVLVSLIKNKLQNTFSNDDTSFLNNVELIPWMQDHPLISMIGLILLMMLIQRKTSSYERDTPDDEDTNRIPHAIIKCPDEAVVSDSITFSAENSYDEDGSIIEFQWDFGDGVTKNGKTVVHSYEEPGIYLVTLTVIDSDQESSEKTFQITIYSSRDELNNGDSNDDGMQFWIISAVLTAILFIGVILLVFRRKIFE